MKKTLIGILTILTVSTSASGQTYSTKPDSRYQNLEVRMALQSALHKIYLTAREVCDNSPSRCDAFAYPFRDYPMSELIFICKHKFLANEIMPGQCPDPFGRPH